MTTSPAGAIPELNTLSTRLRVARDYAEVAARLGYTPRHVARLAAVGSLPALRLPSPAGQGRFLFDPTEIERIAARKEARTA